MRRAGSTRPTCTRRVGALHVVRASEEKCPEDPCPSPRDISNPVFWTPVGDRIDEIKQASQACGAQKVLILGAGLAGLSAAHELVEANPKHQVTVLEGSNRVGGRAFTWRSKDGRFSGERGPMRIPASHDYTLHYINLLGLETREFNNEEQYWQTGEEVADLVNEPNEPELNDYVEKIYPKFKDGLRGDEQWAHDQRTCNGDIVGPGGIIGKYLTGWIGGLVDAAREGDERAIRIGTALLAGDFTGFEEFDKVDTREAMVNAGASPAAIELVARVSTFQMIFSWSYLAFIRDELVEPSQFSEIVGGSDTLPTALYKRLEDKQPGVVQLKQEITCIDAENKFVVVRDGATGQERKEHYDKLLVTIPFPVLKKMELRGFSDGKMHAIQNFGLASSTKDLVAYEKRFWEEEGIFSGRSKSDAPAPDVLHMRECYYPADRLGEARGDKPCENPGSWSIFWGGFGRRYKGAAKSVPSTPGTLLASYQFNEGAQFLGCINKKERMDTVLDVVQKIHPNADVKDFEYYDAWTWDDFKWSQGAFAILGKEKLIKYYADAKSSEKDVFFAGEHVSVAQGWMLGALEAGLRETLAILKSCR